jgi:hypothetical protein
MMKSLTYQITKIFEASQQEYEDAKEMMKKIKERLK